jgi:hypothetical protein
MECNLMAKIKVVEPYQTSREMYERVHELQAAGTRGVYRLKMIEGEGKEQEIIYTVRYPKDVDVEPTIDNNDSDGADSGVVEVAQQPNA